MAASKILVVEDNPTTRKMFRVALESEGYSVIEAPDGATAILRMGEAPDLVLQDFVLPDMNGVELNRRLRQHANGVDIPIIALSGFLSRMEEAEATNAAFNAYLLKPIEPSRLLDAVRGYLQDQGGVSPNAGRGYQVLVADDDPVQLKLTRLRLVESGFSVATAENGRDALEAAKANPPDVILCDVLMPGLDGFEMCLSTRQVAALERVPVVLISSHYLEAQDIEFAKEIGATDLLMRPVEVRDIVETLLRAINLSRPSGSTLPTERLQREHEHRAVRQLERQTLLNAGFAQRCSLYAAQLSLLNSVTDALSRSGDTVETLRKVLGSCLDAAGIGKGVLYIRDSGGRVSVSFSIGFSIVEVGALPAFFGVGSVLDEVIDTDAAIAIPSVAVPVEAARSVLKGAGLASALVVPLAAGGAKLGALFLGSPTSDVTDPDHFTFAVALGAQIGQALRLSATWDLLAASEERFSGIFHRSPAGIALGTADTGRLLEVNDRCLEILAFSREEMLGKTLDELHVWNDPSDRDQVSGALNGQDPILECECRLKRKSGEVFDALISVETTAFPRERSVLMMFSDITRRKQAERAQAQLEHQLRQAQKIEAIGRLAGGVAHDFNNLLTVILGHCHVIVSAIGEDHPLAGSVREISRAGEHASSLTRQLLAFSRQQMLEAKVLDVNTIVRDVEKMLARVIGEDVELRTVLGEGIGNITADPSQIEQVLLNLAVNARDAMPDGGTLTLETSTAVIDEPHARERAGLKAGTYVLLTVTDNGVGMDEETASQVFEPFFTTKGIGKGTGLGLATIHGIVHQSGGHIEVSSEPGRGTSFRIYLPRTCRGVPAKAEEPPTKQPTRGTETILLMEDDAGVRSLARHVLESEGYTVVEASSGRAAAEAVAAHRGPIHLIVSDVVMPGIRGPRAVGELLEVHPEASVIFMSGYIDDLITKDPILSNSAFLQKPFTPESLARRVRDVLDAARRADGSPSSKYVAR